MFRIVFHDIPHIVFEPIAATAGISLILYIYISFCRKKRKNLFLPVVIVTTILFFIIWRSLCYLVMTSSRYSLIILIPSIVFSSLLPYFLKVVLNRKCDIYYRPVYLTYFVVITIICYNKDLRFNNYGIYPKSVIEVATRKSKEFKSVKYFSLAPHEVERLYYYLYLGNYPMEKFSICSLDYYHRWRFFLSKNMREGNHSAANFYFAYQSAQEPDVFPGELKLHKDEWNVISKHYTSKRKNKYLVLYLYTPKRS